jgi:hypothetical protein
MVMDFFMVDFRCLKGGAPAAFQQLKQGVGVLARFVGKRLGGLGQLCVGVVPLHLGMVSHLAGAAAAAHGGVRFDDEHLELLSDLDIDSRMIETI